MREGLSRAASGRRGKLGSMHVTHITSCSLFRLSFQPIRLSQIVSKQHTMHYDVQPHVALVTTTPEQFTNQPGIITNPDLFVLFTSVMLLPFTLIIELQYISVHLKVNSLFPFPFLLSYKVSPECNRLWPSHRSLMAHRKKDHNTEDGSQIITWNELP